MNMPVVNIDNSARVLELLEDLLPSKEIGSLVAGQILPGSGETVIWWIPQPARSS